MVKFNRKWQRGGLFLLALCFSPWAQAEDSKKGILWAEAQISERQPFVQQSVVYLIMVVSQTPLSAIDPRPPVVSGAALERLDDQPVNYTANFKGNFYHIAAFRYALTPLTLGAIDIAPAHFKVTLATQWNSAYPYGMGQPKSPALELSTNPLAIHSQPPAAAQQPWLPLYALRLSGKLDKGTQPGVGEPLTLTLTLNGTGAGGEQLPGLAAQLENLPDFKVYPERPQTSREIISDENILLLSGKRVETYTLIPQRAGQLALPELRLNWWNVRMRKEESVLWPAHTLNVAESGGSSSWVSGLRTGADNLALGAGLPLFWQMASNAFLFALGWWLGARHPGTARIQAAARRLWTASAPLRRALARFFSKTAPDAVQSKPLRQRLHAGLRNLSPRHWAQQHGHSVLSLRVWAGFLLRRIDHADTPEAVYRVLSEFAHLRLGVPQAAALPEIARACGLAYPRLARQDARDLFGELEEALYAKNKKFDMLTWKDRFDEVFGVLPWRAPNTAKIPQARGLPALNPS